MASGDTILSLTAVPLDSLTSTESPNSGYNRQVSVLDNSVVVLTVQNDLASTGGRPTTFQFQPGLTYDITIKEH